MNTMIPNQPLSQAVTMTVACQQKTPGKTAEPGLKHDVGSVASQFQIYGEYLLAVPYGSGHINDTYCAVFRQAGLAVRYLL